MLLPVCEPGTTKALQPSPACGHSSPANAPAAAQRFPKL